MATRPARHERPSDVGTPAADGALAHRRRRRWIVAGVVVVAVLAVGALVAVRWIRGGARTVMVADVDAPSGPTVPANPTVLRPPQGVYLYRGSGTDKLDKPPKEQSQGPTMPGTVAQQSNGCWSFRIEYSTNHWQSWEYCPAKGGLDEAGGSSFQRWNFGVMTNETTSTFRCNSPTIKADQHPGDVWKQRCTGTSTGVHGTTHSDGPYRFIGTETLTIGGQRVRAYHYRRNRTTSGNQTGTERSDIWFSAEAGMPLRNVRRLEATSSTVIGKVHYTEDGEFELTSLRPKR